MNFNSKLGFNCVTCFRIIQYSHNHSVQKLSTEGTSCQKLGTEEMNLPIKLLLFCNQKEQYQQPPSNTNIIVTKRGHEKCGFS